ncbi:hypothetical protein ACWF94_01405, partial [Streptomyces sp. NPDC055078]
HRHRELCERAVDALEIAAGLEAHGVTDRTVARFRHRDVFALAEELYARVPRGEEPARPPARAAGGGRRTRLLPMVLLTLLPGALGVLTLTGRAALDGVLRTAVTVTGALAAAVAVALCLRHGPLRARVRTPRAARLWIVWLLGFAVYGEGLISDLIGGGPQGLPPATAAPLAGLAVAVMPAAWCAHLFAVRARRGLDGSRALDDFASGTRPLLLAVVALYAGALGALLALGEVLPALSEALPVLGETVRPYGALAPAAATAALGVLLFLARLLVVHGYAEAAATGLALACAAEAAALALLLAGRLPGCGFLATPVEAAVAAWGAGAVPAVACALAGAGLLAHATAALSRASAHTV